MEEKPEEKTSPTHPELDLEYSQVNDNIRFLADVRFKLLALLPALGGVALYTLVNAALEAGAKALGQSNPVLLATLLGSLIGLLATLGLTLYDQRNSELYNALIDRAQWLEEHFGVPSTPGGLKQAAHGGQFNERPQPRRSLLFSARHDLALALIYGPLLGSWLFPILYPALRLSNVADGSAQLIAAGAASIAALACTGWLVILDKHERQLYEVAKKRDDIKP